MNLTQLIFYVILLASLNSLSISVLAETTMNFRGFLVETLPCSLNSGGTVEVSFGDQISIQKVASGIYHQPVELGGLECENSSESLLVTLQWSGSPANFDADDATVVTAEQNALGVKMYADGQPLKLDTPFKLNGLSLPKLEAVLVQDYGVELEDGEFSALGVFRAEYQ